MSAAVLEEMRRAGIAKNQLDVAALALRSMADLLGNAEPFSQRSDGEGEIAWCIGFHDLRLSLEFGNYRAEVALVENAFSFQGDERVDDGAEGEVGTDHVSLTVKMSVERST